jgi:hypothetical protein
LNGMAWGPTRWSYCRSFGTSMVTISFCAVA